MRIAYVNLHLGEQILRGGVGRKVRAQLRLWQDAGHEAGLFLHTPDRFTLPDVRMFAFSSATRLPLARPLTREASRSRALGTLIRAVTDDQPDVIYLRFGLFFPPLRSLFDVAPVVLELNSNDQDEYRSRGPVFYWYNRLTRGFLLAGASGWAPVAVEILGYVENRRFRKPYRVIANGIDLSLFEPLPPPENPRPRLVFAGSPGYPWHGVDKLPALARCCPDLDFEVVGYQAADLHAAPPANMRFHGFIPSEGMRAVLSRCDLALGTLALHRKQMDEASPLKVREAAALGLPLVLAYQDTDLSNRGLTAVLQIPNREDNLETHAQTIREFAHAMRGQRLDRVVAGPLIDLQLKEDERLRFMEQFTRGS